jgi:type IV pilus assembly protein PilY1
MKAMHVRPNDAMTANDHERTSTRNARYLRALAWCLTAAWALVLADATAFAQYGPDVRSIRPNVLLAIDTSGSMERRIECVCTTPECTECMPSCLPDGTGKVERNRWNALKETLTGTYQGFSCGKQARVGGIYTGEYDENYYIPYVAGSYTSQSNDGILDTYLPRVRFGMMTFDGVGTLLSTTPLVTDATFETPAFLAQSVTTPGMYSYGDRMRFTLPGCPSPFMIDNGARNADATVGRLISVGSLSTDDAMVNSAIQTALENIRPYGPTPISGMLDDIRYYWTNHPDVLRPTVAGTGDPFWECRDRYVVLLSDGYPNADMRDDPYRCNQPGGTCPYQTPEEIAADMCRFNAGSSRCEGIIRGLFTVGFAPDDPAAVTKLDAIADVGGTDRAFIATNQSELFSTLATILDRTSNGATTRTSPAFSHSTPGEGAQYSYQYNTGFYIGQDAADPWAGVLERTRYVCSADLIPEPQQISDTYNDRFHTVLNNRTQPRRLLTVIPSSAANISKTLVGNMTETPLLNVPSGDVLDPGANKGQGGRSCGTNAQKNSPGKNKEATTESGLVLEEFSTSNARVSQAMLGASSAAERNTIINWVHGAIGTVRENKRLGDIYHSNPTVVGPPTTDVADESYNLFRRRPEVANRPKVVYVGSNDGVIHAFSADTQTITEGPHAGTTLQAGEELWGFIPPMLFPKLKAALASHQWMADATPVVKDIFYDRLPNAPPDGNIYRTILVMGMREGAKGYIALDVTDPFNPKFMWQFSNQYLGYTYGQAGLGQVLVNVNGVMRERGIILLPGGRGDQLTSENGGSCRTDGPIGCPAQGKGQPPVTKGTTNARSRQKCWDNTGRELYIVDPGTGELIRQLDDRVFNAPLTGGVAFYPGEIGQIARAAYITDSDGILWRIDVSSPLLTNWSADPIHDIFWDGDAFDGQPDYFPPVVATDDQGRVVIIHGTGDIDRLDEMANNRVVSITEEVTFNQTSGAISSRTYSLNWQHNMGQGEQPTGQIELYNGIVYFGTFDSATDPLNACTFGQSMLCGFSFNQPLPGTLVPRPGLETVEGSGNFDAQCIGPFRNQILMGVTITQRPTCYVGHLEVDPYFGNRYVVDQMGGGSFYIAGQISGLTSGSAQGGAVATLTRRISSRPPYTRVSSWAGAMEQ